MVNVPTCWRHSSLPRPPGTHGFGPWLLRVRRASAAQVTVAAHGAAAAYRVLSSAQRVPPSPISLPLTVQEPAFRELCRSKVKAQSVWAVPQLGSCATSGLACGSARRSQEEAVPLDAQPVRQVLALAASEAADSTAFDHRSA